MKVKAANKKFTSMALLIVLTSTSLTAEEKNWLRDAPRVPGGSQLENADALKTYLNEHATSVDVDPEFTGETARFVYTMPDGQVIACERGFMGDEFFNFCETEE